MKAVFLDRVTIVENYEREIHSPTKTMPIPSVIALRQYVKPSQHPAFTRFNLFLRDRFACQYCGSGKDLTFDHVVPRSRGGVTSWENVVAACSPCNLKKANKSLKTSGMRLRRPARRPTPEEMHAAGRRFPPNHLHQSWMDFLYWDTELDS